MNLYKISPSNDFLSIIADFVIDNFDDRLDKLKIILPNFFACINLQKILIQKKKISILPNIIPFSDIEAEGVEIFKISSQHISSITYLEEKILLAEIIHNYQKLQFDINQSLKFSPLLAKLFYEFTYNNIAIESIQYLPTVNQAAHWQFIYEFLNHAYQTLQNKIKGLKKQDRATYQINMMDSEIGRINNDSSNLLLVAGVSGDNIFAWNFLKNITMSHNGYIILPPISNSIYLSSNIESREGLYCLKQLLNILEKNLSDFKLLGPNIENENDVLNGLLCSDQEMIIPFPINKRYSLKTKIAYIELEDIYQEAEKISEICKQSPDKMIGIIVNNEKTKEFYCNFLFKYSLEFQDLLSTDLSKTNIMNLIISISDILCSDFDIKKLFILCKNPILNQSPIIKLEQLLLGKNRLVSDNMQLLDLVQKTQDQDLIKWYENLVTLLYKNDIGAKFNDILKNCIQFAEKLCANIWLINKESYEISEYLAELIKFSWNFKIKNKEAFPELFKSLISGTRCFNNNISNSNIIIGRAEDLALLKFDLVIMSDFSEGNFPKSQPISPWLNQQMKDELKLYDNSFGLSLYNFYLLLHNPKIIITRSKKQNSNSKLLESGHMLKLKYILKTSGYDNIDDYIPLEHCEQLVELRGNLINQNQPVVNDIVMIHKSNYVESSFFPSAISITDIETLVRGPYSFYAKKILKLKKYDSIGVDPKPSEFGSFVHNVIEQYTKTYNTIMSDKLEYIVGISANILDNGIFPLSVQKIWNRKFTALAKEFIEFDEERRSQNGVIYSEIKGSLKMSVAGQTIMINGIADRIEVDANSVAIILDYKTGMVPTKKDVLSGKSPQLIITALMSLEGGFGVKINEVSKLVYVKISSSNPYIKLTEIELTQADLASHAKGLRSFLEYYVINKQFSLDIDLLKYNDYKHLARRLP
jgi:ATP-dependent helicase/nuclease subunit B